MKKLNYLFGCCLAGVLLLGACKKASGPPVQQPMEIQGVKVDMPALRQAFSTATPELQAPLNNALSSVRYGMYEKSMMELDKLSNDPGVNEEQKTLITKVLGQLKEVLAKAPPK